MKQAIATWSGGKDSCLALYKAQKLGYSISGLLNTISDDYRRVRFHGLKADLIQVQAQALNIPLTQGTTSASAYQQDFIKLLQHSKTDQVHLICGDINIQTNRDWATATAKQVHLEAVFPLWGMDEEEIVIEFIEAGFKAHIISVNAEALGSEWIGRTLDADSLAELKSLTHVSVAGENGEYHTVVTDGPLFSNPLHIKISQPIKIGNFWFGEVGLDSDK